MHYQDFLATKRIAADSVGFNVALSDLNPILFPFQQIAVQWTLQRGRAAIFFDTGLGKTHMQLDWAYHVNRHTQAPVLILAPLAVSVQTTRKGQELGYDITLCERPEDVREGINITNYEKLHHFDPSIFGGIAIDESSILKGMFDAPTRKLINDFASVIPYRSSWSATPAPNDLLELVNQAEFLGIMSESDAKGVFFTQDGNSSNKYRLRGHAQKAFWEWVSSWAIAARRPSDLGAFDDSTYDLPPLHIEHIAIDTGWKPEGYLIPTMAVGLSEQRQARRESLTDRVQAAIEIINKAHESIYTECGNPNTQSADVQSINQIQKNEKNANSKDVPPKRTNDTWQNTTPLTKKNTSNNEKGIRTQKTRHDENAIEQMRSIGKSIKNQSGTAINNQSEMGDYYLNSESPLVDTTNSYNDKTTSALFAEQNTQKQEESDYTLTTVTQQVKYEDYYAENAISELESSRIPSKASPAPLSTYLHQPNSWIIWCDLNAEQEALEKAFGDRAFSVYGSLSSAEKERRIFGWLDGERPILISKPSICGFGINMQQCANVVFIGLSHSYEMFYQAIRRCWRYGQTQPVTAYVITSAAEESIIANIQRKEKQANGMMDSIVQHMSEFSLGAASREEMDYREAMAGTDKWTMYLGDSVLTIDNVPDNSVGLCVFSPPFPGMYAYTNSRHDMGNVKSIAEMIEQFRFLVKPDKLQRVMMPGRNVFIHLTQGVAQKGRDGYIGLKDFRGEVIRTMQEEGWIYYGEITIQKNPQIKAIRTKDAGLMFKSLATDSAKMHPALPDTVLQFRRVGDNPEPIKAGISKKYNNPNGWVTSEEWIKWAAPIWTDIDETNVLNVSVARESNDERHLCPLQLDVIERIVKVWSNPNDVVLSPFAGIGSEGVVSLKYGRRFVGMELKEGYWKWACRHLEQAVMESQQDDLFSLMNVEVGA